LILGVLIASAMLSAPAAAQMTSTGIDCSQINSLNLLKQDNMRAGLVLIECGIVRGGRPTRPGDEAPVAPNVRASNRACSNAQSCTKSESMVWGSTDGQTIVVNFNDESNGNGSNYSGVSYSQDGGATFTQITPSPFQSGHGTNFGDPIVVFNAKLNKWFAGDLATSCGGQGIGLWTSNNGKTWATGACAHSGGSDDRESMWVDNEPSSGTYGRMYLSWTDFGFGSGALSVTHSDDGTTWSAPVRLTSNFIRPVQITGSPVGAPRFEGANSTVFVAGMDEGGGGCATRQNIMYKSLDGGTTWTSKTLGPRFNPICDGSCDNPYFVKVNPIIRHMGWGQPGVGPNGVVHYAYAGLGTNGDPGNIYYVRSTDNGTTWSTPIKLNQSKNKPFKSQWMPSLSADGNGKVTVSWYDRRKSTSACNVATDKACKYKRVARQSANNGASFLPEIDVSPLMAQPQQQDPFVQACYAGDYDYNTTINGNAFITWTDGRRNVGGIHVQDVEFATIPVP
jgi:hypothetical protein